MLYFVYLRKNVFLFIFLSKVGFYVRNVQNNCESSYLGDGVWVNGAHGLQES